MLHLIWLSDFLRVLAELDDLEEGGGVDCSSLCFRVGSCIRTCEKITSAMANSTGFPCIAAGLCPATDEFGEVSCQWSYKNLACEPASACVYKFPKCELRSGMKKWKQVNHLVSSHIGAFDDAFRHRKRCSEPGAGPYCIREAEGIGLLAEWGSLALTFVGGAICSIHAIETPGGDDGESASVYQSPLLRHARTCAYFVLRPAAAPMPCRADCVSALSVTTRRSTVAHLLDDHDGLLPCRALHGRAALSLVTLL